MADPAFMEQLLGEVAAEAEARAGDTHVHIGARRNYNAADMERKENTQYEAVVKSPFKVHLAKIKEKENN